MAQFRVSFYKDVMGNAGKDVDACQASFDVDAKDERQAVKLAKQRFCSERNIEVWTVNADRFEVERHAPAEARPNHDTAIVRSVPIDD